MIFVYPYKIKDSNFCIEHSIKLIRKYYDNAWIVTVGDSCGLEDDNIPFVDSYSVRGCNVTAKLLAASYKYAEFVFMNDDFFINDRYKLHKIYGSLEDLENKDKASREWNESVTNTKHWLEHNGYSYKSFECHQPLILNGKKLIDLFDMVAWEDTPHFVKSLYFNVYKPKEVLPIDNTKLIKFDKKRADTLLTMFGCLSIGGDFLTVSGSDYIKKLSI